MDALFHFGTLMTIFRPCIDIHAGKVKQIVGGTLDTQELVTNFESDVGPEFYAKLYQKHQLKGAHVIQLGQGCQQAALEALKAWPGELQIGGGVHLDNAQEWIDQGASHVIVTSWLFENDELSWNRVKALSAKVGADRLVIDLSCRKVAHSWFVATNRWQTITQTEVNAQLLQDLSQYCAEFLVHAADVEGLCRGMDLELIALLGQSSPIPVTYAGGASSLEDLEKVKAYSGGKVDLTIGSALDLFGGNLSFEACVEWNQKHSTN